MRKPLFIGSQDWCSIPFQSIPPTPCQQVMTIGSSIAATLEAVDRLDDRHVTCEQLCAMADMFENTRSRLDGWQTWFASLSSDPLFTAKECNGHTTLHFLDTAAANGLTHYWAFSIICYTYLEELAILCPTIATKTTGQRRYSNESRPRSALALQFATWILQSTTYLTQDDQKLFGATSLAYPFKIGFGYLKRNGHMEGRKVCAAAIQRLASKDYHYLIKFANSNRGGLASLAVAHRHLDH